MDNDRGDRHFERQRRRNGQLSRTARRSLLPSNGHLANNESVSKPAVKVNGEVIVDAVADGGLSDAAAGNEVFVFLEDDNVGAENQSTPPEYLYKEDNLTMIPLDQECRDTFPLAGAVTQMWPTSLLPANKESFGLMSCGSSQSYGMPAGGVYSQAVNSSPLAVTPLLSVPSPQTV